MSDTTRISAYWRERTIRDYELADHAHLQLVDLRMDRPALELIREADPVEAARLAREAAAHLRRGLLNG